MFDYISLEIAIAKIEYTSYTEPTKDVLYNFLTCILCDIQYDAVITRSVFSKILTIDTPELAREGET